MRDPLDLDKRKTNGVLVDRRNCSYYEQIVKSDCEVISSYSVGSILFLWLLRKYVRGNFHVDGACCVTLNF